MILIFGCPSNFKKIFETHLATLAEDILIKEKIRLNNVSLIVNQDILNLNIFFINEIMQNYNKVIKDFPGLPLLPLNYITGDYFINSQKNKFIREQTSYDKEALKHQYESSKTKLNTGKLAFFDEIINKNKNNLYFIDGPGKLKFI